MVHQINHTLSCSFDGLPRPTVTWRLNGTTLVTGRDNYVIREIDNTSHVDIVGTKLPLGQSTPAGYSVATSALYNIQY